MIVGYQFLEFLDALLQTLCVRQCRIPVARGFLSVRKGMRGKCIVAEASAHVGLQFVDALILSRNTAVADRLFTSAFDLFVEKTVNRMFQCHNGLIEKKRKAV